MFIEGVQGKTTQIMLLVHKDYSELEVIEKKQKQGKLFALPFLPGKARQLCPRDKFRLLIVQKCHQRNVHNKPD